MVEDFESIASLWIANKRHMIYNSAICCYVGVMEITQPFMFLGNVVEWNEESVCYDWKDAKRMVTNVQAGRSGKVGEDYSVGGGRSKHGAANQMKDGYIRVGTIKCSAFGGLWKCD